MTASSAPQAAASAGGDVAWRCLPFERLSVFELQRIHVARQQVFVVEQACVFPDADEHDAEAHHLTASAEAGGELWAYARLLAPGAKYAEASIGRVLTTSRARGTGLGRGLMARALAETAALWPGAIVRIGAQARLQAFYAEFGFRVDGATYMEDGILHVEMMRTG